VPAGDADLVAEDMAQALRDWSGHAYQAERDAALAWALAQADDAVRALAVGRVDWLPGALALPDFASAAGVNVHDGVTWFGKEELESVLQAMLVEALTTAPGRAAPAVDARPQDGLAVPLLVALLDARSLALAAAARAGYRVDRLAAELSDR
jgi:hypothetical protein